MRDIYRNLCGAAMLMVVVTASYYASQKYISPPVRNALIELAERIQLEKVIKLHDEAQENSKNGHFKSLEEIPNINLDLG